MCKRSTCASAPCVHARIPRSSRIFLSNARGFKGIVVARRAVRHIIANSASPMETNLAMMLCLPYALGGYGIAQPKMNHRVDIPDSLRHCGDSSYRICDLYWPDAALAIEYDSDLAHAGIYKTASDAVRRSTLEALGMAVMSITWPQVVDAAVFDHLAHLVARKTGKQLRYDLDSFKWQQRKLRSLIFPRF